MKIARRELRCWTAIAPKDQLEYMGDT